MELLGIPTGFPTLDDVLAGLQPEQLWTLAGEPKRGKSTIALAIAMAAQAYGAKVGFVTHEMSNAETQDRYLCIGAHVGLTNIQRGTLSDDDKRRIDQFEEEVLDYPHDLIMIHDMSAVTTMTGLAAKCEQHSFDLLVVDGIYLMQNEDGHPSGSSQALTSLTRSAKRLCQTARIPILCTTQALTSKVSATRGIGLDSIGYTSSFAQDSDVILGIDRPDLTLPVSTLKIMAARNALGRQFRIRADLGTGYIEEMAGGFSESYGQAFGDD
jgi:replicative DNA helicase